MTSCRNYKSALDHLNSCLRLNSLSYHDIIAAKIYYRTERCENASKIFKLNLTFTDKDFEIFLQDLDAVTWDSKKSLGDKSIYGIIWLTNGRWLEKREHDHDDYEDRIYPWELKKSPIIPKDLF